MRRQNVKVALRGNGNFVRKNAQKLSLNDKSSVKIVAFENTVNIAVPPIILTYRLPEPQTAKRALIRNLIFANLPAQPARLESSPFVNLTVQENAALGTAASSS